MIGRNRALDVLLALNLIHELNFSLDNILPHIKLLEIVVLRFCPNLLLVQLDHLNSINR